MSSRASIASASSASVPLVSSASPPDEGLLRGALRRLDGWMTTPLSAQQVVVRLSLYLVLAANWPLWLQITRIGGAPRDRKSVV